MKQWILPHFPCPHCNEAVKGVRVLFSITAKSKTRVAITCSACHVVTSFGMSTEKFRETMNNSPPTETDN